MWLLEKTAELLAASSKKASVQCYPLTWKPKKWSQFKRCAPTKYFQYAYDKVRPDHWKKYTNYVKNVVRTGASCDYFVGTVVRASGYDGIGLSHDSMHSNMTKDTKKWKKVKKAQRGDICQKLKMPKMTRLTLLHSRINWWLWRIYDLSSDKIIHSLKCRNVIIKLGVLKLFTIMHGVI